MAAVDWVWLDSEGERVTWIDPDGVEWKLNVNWGVEGRFAAPSRFEEDGIPGHDGLRFREVYWDARDIELPIYMRGATEAALRMRMREAVSAFNPKRGEGILRVVSPTGDTRQISCRYVSGLEMSEQLGEDSGFFHQVATITLRAHDPHWSAETITEDFGITETPSFFPWPPLRLTASEIVIEADIVNDGDMESWPVWTVNGPGELFRFTNVTTGKVLELQETITVDVGDSIVIDTRPFRKSVRRADGENLFAKLAKTASLWPLVLGNNRVRLEMSASQNGVSSLTLVYTPRYLTA